MKNTFRLQSVEIYRGYIPAFTESFIFLIVFYSANLPLYHYKVKNKMFKKRREQFRNKTFSCINPMGMLFHDRSMHISTRRIARQCDKEEVGQASSRLSKLDGEN